jgi:hypothetical protein
VAVQLSLALLLSIPAQTNTSMGSEWGVEWVGRGGGGARCATRGTEGEDNRSDVCVCYVRAYLLWSPEPQKRKQLSCFFLKTQVPRSLPRWIIYPINKKRVCAVRGGAQPSAGHTGSQRAPCKIQRTKNVTKVTCDVHLLPKRKKHKPQKSPAAGKIFSTSD